MNAEPGFVLAIFGLGPTEMIVVGVVAVLLFGSRLPDVARSMGKSMLEFKRGMSGLEDEMNNAASNRPRGNTSKSYHDVDDREESTAPKFEPPASEPTAEAADDEQHV